MQRSEQILAARGSDDPNKVSIGVRMLATPTATGDITYPIPSPLQCARNCAAASMRVSSMCSSRGRRGAAEYRLGARVVRV